jgi:hypothetical protein
MECREHLLICPDDCAMQARFDLLQAMINTLKEKNIHVEICNAIQHKLCHYLCLGHPIVQDYLSVIMDAIRHQNIIRWRQFLCGYVSTHWGKAQEHLQSDTDSQASNCGRTLIQATLSLHQGIWQDQNYIRKMSRCSDVPSNGHYPIRNT